MTDTEIQMLWLYTAEIWPQFRIPDPGAPTAMKLAAWSDQLRDLDLPLCRGAVAAETHREFPPNPGQIRRKAQEVDDLRNGIRPPPEVDEAWREVMESFGRPLNWSHPTVEATVNAIGYRNIRLTENIDVVRGQFTKMYGVCRERHQRDAAAMPPALANLMDGAIKRVDDVLGLGEAS